MATERTEWFLKTTADAFVAGKTRIPGLAMTSLFPDVENPRGDFLVVKIGPAKQRDGFAGWWCEVKLMEVT